MHVTCFKILIFNIIKPWRFFKIYDKINSDNLISFHSRIVHKLSFRIVHCKLWVGDNSIKPIPFHAHPMHIVCMTIRRILSFFSDPAFGSFWVDICIIFIIDWYWRIWIYLRISLRHRILVVSFVAHLETFTWDNPIIRTSNELFRRSLSSTYLRMNLLHHYVKHLKFSRLIFAFLKWKILILYY